jgi:hypothetical protein
LDPGISSETNDAEKPAGHVMPDDLEDLSRASAFQQRWGMTPIGTEPGGIAGISPGQIQAMTHSAPTPPTPGQARTQEIAGRIGRDMFGMITAPFTALQAAERLTGTAMETAPGQPQGFTHQQAGDALSTLSNLSGINALSRGLVPTTSGEFGIFGGRGFGTAGGGLTLSDRALQDRPSHIVADMIDSNGNHAGVVRYNYDKDTNNVTVHWAGKKELFDRSPYAAENVNSLGQKEIAGLIPSFMKKYPDLFTITAHRISGARMQANTGADLEDAIIPVRKPRTPEEQAIMDDVIIPQRQERRERAQRIQERRTASRERISAVRPRAARLAGQNPGPPTRPAVPQPSSAPISQTDLEQLFHSLTRELEAIGNP